jgi:autotransporter-associated beta strand protein
LYSAPHQNSANVTKWTSAPFNNDWTSSLFVSQDTVALESVAVDFCAAEPTFAGVMVSNVDNWLHEAALAHDPPSGTFYDPENDGTRLASLGVHEHWDSAATKRYSRNLGTGSGIELVTTGPPNVWTWTGGAGTSDWDDPQNWLDEAAQHTVPASAASSALTFSGATQPAPVQNTGGPVILNRLIFSDTGASFSISGAALRFVANGMTAPKLVQSAAQAHAITNALEQQDTLIVDCAGAGTLTLDGNLSGAGGLAKTGSGKLVLSGSADYDGTTTVSAGRLMVQGTLEAKSSAVNVLPAGILGGAGAVMRHVNVQGGTLAPGD